MKKFSPEILFYFILFYFRVWLPRTLLPAPLSNHLFGHFRRGGPAPRRPSPENAGKERVKSNFRHYHWVNAARPLSSSAHLLNKLHPGRRAL
jgi:hypothetical protein